MVCLNHMSIQENINYLYLMNLNKKSVLYLVKKVESTPKKP